jgi:uncharacterized protein
MDLNLYFAKNKKIALGFSGGVDSSYLLYAAHLTGVDIKPYFVKTVFGTRSDITDAERIADYVGCGMEVIEVDIMSHPKVTANDSQRCYHCKKVIFSAIIDRAKLEGYTTVIDGTNASDDSSDRPGMKALSELGVDSPLRICGITKSEIRKLSKEAGLFTHDKPSCSCLATRIITGQPLTEETLSVVDAAESAMIEMGFTRDMRVRLSGSRALIELPESQMTLAINKRENILEILGKNIKEIHLNLKPRRV